MAAYIRGNLAVEERQSPTQRVKIKETRKVVYRTSQLPMQEKLLYLFTVLICVVVACVVIWRYAQIYQMNTRIHNVEKEITRLEADNSALKEKLSKMMNPELYMKEAAKAGMIHVKDEDLVRVPVEAKSESDGIALKP
ncbi:MAG: cell division initiation protein [Paenibacillaceae bacterium]|jgi:cell division protein FtsL|nr:cell division initiation protein [Paenibacillaceae bacterium]